MITSKENMLMALNHEIPEYVPCFTENIMCGAEQETFENGPLTGGKDGFGVEWVVTSSSGGKSTPAANKYVFEYIDEWEDKLILPDLDAYDWEGEAKRQLSMGDRDKQLVSYDAYNWSFMRLTHLMGFENAMCAFVEDEDACKAFFDRIADYKIRQAERIHHYFKPDMIVSYDDVATERGLFMSPDVYRRLIKPSHKKVNDAIRDMGIMPAIHCCGKCEDIIQDFIEEGNVAWSSAQPMNDIAGILQKYGKQITVFGGYDTNGRPGQAGVPEEVIRAEVRRAIDTYAKYGSYVFFGFLLKDTLDFNEIIKDMIPMFDEAMTYGRDFYKK